MEWLLTGEGERYRSGADAGGPSVGDGGQAGSVMPQALVPDERRVSSLLDLLAQLDHASRDAVLSDCFARATNAQQLAELRRAVNELTAQKQA